MITWTTTKGTKVSLAILTAEESMIDHNIMLPCYSLDIRVGDTVWGGADLIEHPQHGTVLKAFTGGSMVKVPTEYRAAVASLLDEYRAEISRRHDASMAAEAEYEAHRAVMRKALGSACVDE